MQIVGEVNNRLVFKDGRIKMLDGSSVAAYLRSVGFKDGDEINIVKHQPMKDTVSMVGRPLAS